MIVSSNCEQQWSYRKLLQTTLKGTQNVDDTGLDRHLILVHVVFYDALRQLKRDQSIAAESRDVRPTNCHHLGEETVHEAVETTLLYAYHTTANAR